MVYRNYTNTRNDHESEEEIGKSLLDDSEMSKKYTWTWYGVKIIKQIIAKSEPNENLIDEYYTENDINHFEETIVIVHAQSFDHAYKIAEANAKQDNEDYINIYGQIVSWKFIDTIDCFLIGEEIKSGVEVYSCFYDTKSNDEEFIEKHYTIENGCRIGRHL